MKLLFRNFFVLLLALSMQTACADVVVIVSARSQITNLTAEQTANIFLGKVGTFPNGSRVVPIDQMEGSAIRDEFYIKVARKNSSQLTAYWAKAIFSGDSFPPQPLDGNTAVRHAVAGNPYTIGYIDSNAVDNSVRVVLKP